MHTIADSQEPHDDDTVAAPAFVHPTVPYCTLTVNLKKTSYIVFGTPGKIKKHTDCSIYLDGVEIERKFESKFLGIIIDDTLTWKSHIKYIGNKIAKMLD